MRRPRGFRLSAEMATRRIRQYAVKSSNVVLTLHAQEQMAARDLIAPELYRILRERVVHDPPVQEGGEWKAVMELRMPGGRDAASVTVLAAGETLVVVTVMWRER